MCNPMKRFALISSVFLLLLQQLGTSAWAKGPDKPEVRIHGAVIDMGKEPAVSPGLEPRVNSGRRAWIVQFAGPIRPEQKANLETLGCRLLDYLPDFAFRAVMDDQVREAVARLPYIAGVVRFQPEYKIGQSLKKGALAPSREKVSVNLKLDDPRDMSDVLAAVEKKGGEVLDLGKDTLRVTLETADIADLAALEGVSWIEEHVPMQLLNDTTRWVIQSNIQGDTKIWDQGVRGEEQIIAIGDTGLDYDMPWFRDPSGVSIGPSHRKIVGYDPTYGDDYDADSPGHGTHVAGTVAGDRTPFGEVSNPDANGMAPKSRLFIQDLTPGAGNFVYPPDDLGQLFAPASAAGASLHTNSWGNSSNVYGSSAASTDRFLWEHKQFLALFANGNSGPGAGTVGEPATAKNVISVGATFNGSNAENLASFSSNGPTADGRIKPTVTAPGVNIVSADSDGLKGSNNSGTITLSGTSMATPAVAGAAALVRQYFTSGYYPLGSAGSSNAFIPSAALIKAVLINSAQGMNGLNTDGPIPATGQGWGRINLGNALSFAGYPTGLQVVDESNGLDTGGAWFKDVAVAGVQPFKVTLVWTDYPGATGAAKALVNDLDLVVVAPDGTRFPGNAFANGESVPSSSGDRLNVEEQVLIKAPVTGTYRVSVTGVNVPYGPQPFAVAITGTQTSASKGFLWLDKKSYTSQGLLEIHLSDADLNRDPAVAENATVVVTSGTEPAGETAVLAESAPNSGIFVGKLPMSAGPAVPNDGRLQVSDGNTVTATYHDADDGSGNAATSTATAKVDNVAPVISALSVGGITDTAAVVVWSTDEPCDSVVNYGETKALGGKITDAGLTTQHSMSLGTLKEGATYFLTVNSRDEAGNTASEPAGEPASFTTLNLPPHLTVLSSEGATTSRSSTVISGVCSDPSGIASVTVNGTPVTPRQSDGYYALTVALQVGSNAFTVVGTDTVGNNATSTINVTRLQPSDLAMQQVAGPSSAYQGGKVVITDTVCNNGLGNATSFLVGFYLSSDPTLSSDDWFIGSRAVASLAANQCSNGSTEVTIPALTTGGPLYLVAFADYKKSQADANWSNNAVTGNQITLPYPQLMAPVSILVPETESTGTIRVRWSYSNVSGVTYQLEASKDNGAFSVVYSGTGTLTYVTVATSGSYVFRVKCTKTNYIDSAYTVSSSCTVKLACGAPASILVPATNTTGTLAVRWNASNVSGVTYQLEASKDNGAFSVVYSGTGTLTYVTVATSGSYVFRVKCTKANYLESAYTVSSSCTVKLTCGTPTAIFVPAMASTKTFLVRWNAGTVNGVTYQLEGSKDNGAYTVFYKGTSTMSYVTVPGSGNYVFRVKATKAGYLDSDWRVSGVVAVSIPIPQ